MQSRRLWSEQPRTAVSPTCPGSTLCGRWPCSPSSSTTPRSAGCRAASSASTSSSSISGYLITSLLLREFRRGGHVRLGRFWLRRARRLLPAVGVLIAVTMIAAAIVEPDRIDAAARRRDRLARLLRQLALHPRPPVLLRTVPAAVAVHPPLVALGRGAVLPLLAARLRRRDEAVRPRPAAARGGRPARSPRSPSPGSSSTPAATPPASTTAPTPTRSGCWPASPWPWSGARSSCAGGAPGRWSARSSTSSASSPSPTSSSASSTSTTTTSRSGTAATSGWPWSRRCCWPCSPTPRPGSAACSDRRRCSGSACAATASTSGTGRC